MNGTRVASGVAAERLSEHSIKSLLVRFAKLLNTYRHSFVSCLRLIAVGAQHPIPPREIEAKIAARVCKVREVPA
jgi:hypothetical protein